jgi:L-fuconolactonase
VWPPAPGCGRARSGLAGLRALAGAGVTFDIVVRPGQLPAAVAAARSVPGLTVVLDHLGGPPAGSGQGASGGPWASAIRSLAQLPNVTCKLPGMHTRQADAAGLRPYYQTVLSAFGPARLLFGTDWPVSALTAPYGQVCGLYRELTADLSASETPGDLRRHRPPRLPPAIAAPRQRPPAAVTQLTRA